MHKKPNNESKEIPHVFNELNPLKKQIVELFQTGLPYLRNT
jgi:hypothetical protein